MPHPDASLLPAEQLEQLHPAAVFPISGAVWKAAQAAVEITARHHEAKINVMGVQVPRSPTLASVAVTWCKLASWSKPLRLQPYNLSALEERLSGYLWRTHQTCMEELMEYASREAAPRRSDPMQAVARHMVAWGSDQIGGLAFEDLLLLLGNVTMGQPVTLRVPLLHWLASRTASRCGLKLVWKTPSFTTTAAGVKLPSLCPPVSAGVAERAPRLGQRWQLGHARCFEAHSVTGEEPHAATRASPEQHTAVAVNSAGAHTCRPREHAAGAGWAWMCPGATSWAGRCRSSGPRPPIRYVRPCAAEFGPGFSDGRP